MSYHKAIPIDDKDDDYSASNPEIIVVQSPKVRNSLSTSPSSPRYQQHHPHSKKHDNHEKNSSYSTLYTTKPSMLKFPFGIGKKYLMSIMCFLALLVCYVDRVNMSVAIIPMASQYGWSVGTKAVVISSFFYGYVVSQIPGGYIADKVGGKIVLEAAVIWWSFCTFVTPLFTSNIYALIVARALLGLGEGVAHPAVMTIIAQWFAPNERTFVSSVITSGGPVGAAVTQLIIPPIVMHFGWESAFYFGTLLGTVWILVNIPVSGAPFIFSTPSPTPPPTTTPSISDLPPTTTTPSISDLPTTPPSSDLPSTIHPLHSAKHINVHTRSKSLDQDNNAKPTHGQKISEKVWKFLLTHPACWAIYANAFTHGWLWWTTLFWFPTYLSQTYGSSSLERIGVYSTAPVVAYFASSASWAWKADQYISKGVSIQKIRVWSNTLSAIGAGICMLAVVQTKSISMAVCWISAAWIFGGAMKSGALVSHLDIAPKHAGTLFGVVNVFSNIPGIVGVLITGYILEVSGSWGMVFGIPAVLSILGSLVYLKWAESTVLI